MKIPMSLFASTENSSQMQGDKNPAKFELLNSRRGTEIQMTLQKKVIGNTTFHLFHLHLGREKASSKNQASF